MEQIFSDDFSNLLPTEVADTIRESTKQLLVHGARPTLTRGIKWDMHEAMSPGSEFSRYSCDYWRLLQQEWYTIGPECMPAEGGGSSRKRRWRSTGPNGAAPSC